MSTDLASASRRSLATVTIKAAMAASGIGMAVWLTLHMLGNALWLLGPDVMNRYGAGLHGSGVLWPVRLLLVCGIAVHVVGAVITTRRARSARTRRYEAALRPVASTFASRSMRWSGVLLLGFIVQHVTSVYGVDIGLGRLPLLPEAFHHNYAVLVGRPAQSLVLALASVLVALHLRHGLASACQSMGLLPPRGAQLLDRLLGVWTWAVSVGFVLPPLALWAGRLLGR